MHINKAAKIDFDTLHPQLDAYVEGTLPDFPGYRFWAKIDDIPARDRILEVDDPQLAAIIGKTVSFKSHGLYGGRICKLSVRFNDTCVIDFDRGWNYRPRTAEQRAVLKEIIKAFPAS